MHHKSAFPFFSGLLGWNWYMHNFGFPRGEMRFVIQDGIFFLKKGIFGSTFVYRQQIIS
jgi:hypothetical protein